MKKTKTASQEELLGMLGGGERENDQEATDGIKFDEEQVMCEQEDSLRKNDMVW